ncbi:MAG: hypothetical protein U1E65_01660 [Myxococcota bacterium]
MKRALLFSLALVLGAACATPMPHVTPVQADRASARWPDANLAALESGRALYLGRCGSCHRHYLPSELTEAQWMAQIPDMRARAKLNPEQTEAVLRYLLSARE